MIVRLGTLVSATVIFTSAVVPAQSPGSSPANPQLRTELIRMRDEDQAAREGFERAVSRNDTDYADRLTQADTARTGRLKTIVAADGWPTVAAVGRDGVQAAWLLLQHAPDLEWQASMLPVLERSADAGDVSRASVATLTDRVLVRSGKPQRYGSSFSIVDGRLVADAIEDEEHVDTRRAAVGLPSMAEYVALLRESSGLPVEWPRR